MRLKSQKYRTLWQKCVNLKATWPGQPGFFPQGESSIQGRFFIKFPQGLKIKPVFFDGQNNFTEDADGSYIGKINTNLKFFIFLEHDNIDLYVKTKTQ